MTPRIPLPARERRAIGRAVVRRSGAERRHPARDTASRPDVAASRVREAGGPLDVASYACLCGMVFAAAVSTTVACPHCGATQAW
jgi:hypothetical protein